MTLIVADVGGSTALYEALGDHEARRLLAGCIETLVREIAHAGGRVIKTLGDGLLATMPSVTASLAAAARMRDGAAAQGFSVRTAIHAGPVVRDASGDVFGDAVNTAARLCNIAAQTEVLLSAAARDELPPEDRSRLLPLPPIMLRGKLEPVHVFALPSTSAGGPTVAAEPLAPRDRANTLTLHVGEQSVTVAEQPLTIGRSNECDLVVPSPRASRVHAKAFRMGTNVYLTDTSANGTWLVDAHGGTLRLHRERTPLTGSGRLYCGADPSTDDSVPPVHYRVQPADQRPD